MTQMSFFYFSYENFLIPSVSFFRSYVVVVSKPSRNSTRFFFFDFQTYTGRQLAHSHLNLLQNNLKVFFGTKHFSN